MLNDFHWKSSASRKVKTLPPHWFPWFLLPVTGTPFHPQYPHVKMCVVTDQWSQKESNKSRFYKNLTFLRYFLGGGTKAEGGFLESCACRHLCEYMHWIVFLAGQNHWNETTTCKILLAQIHPCAVKWNHTFHNVGTHIGDTPHKQEFPWPVWCPIYIIASKHTHTHTNAWSSPHPPLWYLMRGVVSLKRKKVTCIHALENLFAWPCTSAIPLVL